MSANTTTNADKVVPFGLDDWRELIAPGKYFLILPDASSSQTEQLNCLLRLAIYFAIVMFLFGRYPAALFALFAGVGFAYVLNFASVKKKERFAAVASSQTLQASETGAADGCRRPTKGNPFMNVLPYDDPRMPGACDVEDPTIRRSMDNIFNENLFRDVGDIYHRTASDRQYYTMPSTTVPNDTVAFAKWLYGQDKTCKEDTRQCWSSTTRRGTAF